MPSKARRFLVLFSAILFLAALPVFAQVKAPAFSGEDLEGNLHSLLDYEGKPLVLYFWATWCPACVTEIVAIEKIHEKYKADDVVFLAVSLDTDKERLRRFAEKRGLTFPVLFDGKGWQNEIAGIYGVSRTPSFVIITPDGYVYATGHWGDDLQSRLNHFLTK